MIRQNKTKNLADALLVSLVSTGIFLKGIVLEGISFAGIITGSKDTNFIRVFFVERIIPKSSTKT